MCEKSADPKTRMGRGNRETLKYPLLVSPFKVNPTAGVPVLHWHAQWSCFLGPVHVWGGGCKTKLVVNIRVGKFDGSISLCCLVRENPLKCAGVLPVWVA